MLKTSKKIIASLLAVMLVALMVPFAASAAEDTSFNLKCTKPGFTFQVYKIADIDTNTGKVTPAAALDSTVATLISTGKTVSSEEAQTIINACDNVTTWDSTLTKDAYTSAADKTTSDTFDYGAGMYYVKVTNYSHGSDVAKKAESSLVVTPVYNQTTASWDAAGTIDLSNLKVDDGTTSVTKTIVSVDGQTNTVYDGGKSAITDETKDVLLRLEGSVTGTADKKVTSYTLKDTMDKEINFNEIKSVKLVKNSGAEVTLDKTADYTVTPSTAALINAQTDNHNFSVALSANVLNGTTKFDGSTFYDFDSVVVDYTADIDATFTAGMVKNNHVDLVFRSEGTQADTVVPGNDVKVATLGVNLTKTTTKDNSVLADAQFGLYTDSNCANQVAQLTTTTNGNDIFMDIASGQTDEYNVMPGTYYIKEIKAPANYVISNTVTKVSVNAKMSNSVIVEAAGNYANGYYHYSAVNTPLALPKTGGMGTMMFTIAGATLIVGAGVLFLILMKRKKASK